jgi:hypothetical protein
MEGPAAQAGGGSDWENPLAGAGFRGLRRAISHRGDRRSVCHEEPESGGDNPGWAPTDTDRLVIFYRDEGCGREGYPIDR